MSERLSWVGKVIGGRYRIDEVLGQGGMSAVYKAFDPNLKRVVAVKIIHAHLADDPRFLMRFEEEAAAVAQLRHPNIVQVFDFNHDDDLYYMVQEFIPGETLQQLLRRLQKTGRHIPLNDVITYTENMADAAGFAHQRGMIHRDIKPANIMINVHNQATLMDFGIVKIMGGEKHTATGAVVGTALYLPPELIRGEVPDQRSDVYSLGVTLFEMVSGRPPYEADSAMTLMMMHLNDPIPDLHQLRNDLPPALVAVIEKAMCKNRLERYASMSEMAADLKAVLPGLQAVPGVTVVEPPAPKSQPSPAPFPLKEINTPRADTPAPSAVPPAPASPAIDPTLVTGVTPPPASQPYPSNAPAARAVPPAAAPGWQPQPAAQQPPPPAGGGFDPAAVPHGYAGGPPAAAQKNLPLAVWIGGGVMAVILLILVALQFLPGSTPPAQEAPPIASPTITSAVAAVVPPTETPTATPTTNPVGVLPPAVTNTPEPLPTATLGLPPTATFPADKMFAFIKSITVDENSAYIVDYDTLLFVEQSPGTHVHFFFDTTPAEMAGVPGDGKWFMWAGPRPFNQFKTNSHDPEATQMCVLVANPDHSVQLDTGNCVILPDVNAVTMLTNQICFARPEAGSTAVGELLTGEVSRVRGMSLDEAWWNITNPLDRNTGCWVPRNLTFFHGDPATVGLVDAGN